MTKKPLIIVGGGGHAKVVIDIAEMMGSFRIIAILDDKFTSMQEKNDCQYGPITMLEQLLETQPDASVIIAIGHNQTRRIMAERLDLTNNRYALLAHPGAHISKLAVIAAGTVIMAGAVVNAGAYIDAHAIINSGAVVEHDAVIGAFAHISPNAALAGAVAVGEGAHVGIGASVIPGIQIGSWSIIGAGAAVIHHVQDQSIAVGVPAKAINRT